MSAVPEYTRRAIKNYQEKNREAIRMKQRQYYAENAELIKQKRRARYLAQKLQRQQEIPVH